MTKNYCIVLYNIMTPIDSNPRAARTKTMMLNYINSNSGAFVYSSCMLVAFLATSHGFIKLVENATNGGILAFQHRHLLDEIESDETSFTIQVTFAEIFRVILFVVIVHYAGELGTLIKLPSLVGQIFAGILLGPQVLDAVPFEESIVLLGEIGLILLMFEAGIEVDATLIKNSGARAILMSVTCAVLATGYGFGVSLAMGVADFRGSFSIGATFAQTAIGTCLPVLQDGDLMGAPIGQMILAATMIDDMIALTLLSVMDSFGGDMKVPVIHYFLPIISSVCWLAISGYFALVIAPRALDEFILPKLKRKQSQYFVLYLLMTGVTLAYMPLFTYTKSSYLMGASLAGMTFSQCKMASDAFSECHTIYYWLMKLFFAASIGFQIPVQLFGEARVWVIGSIFVATAGLIKSVAALFVPNFQEKDAIFNLHRRDQVVAALSMMSRGGFGFLISASAFDANLIDAETYASTVLAILIGTILPRYEKMKANAEKDKENTLDATEDGKMPLYLQINIETTKGTWGLLQNMLHNISSIGLKVEEFKSSHTQGIDSTICNKFYLRDDETRVVLRFKTPSIDEMGDEAEIVENRFFEIQGLLKGKLADIEPVIDIYPWSPFDSFGLDALRNLLTRANGDTPSLEFFACLFSILDMDGDGELSEKELKDGLRASNFNIGDHGFHDIMKSMNTSHDGVVSFEEWQQTISFLQKKQRKTMRVTTIQGRNVRAATLPMLPLGGNLSVTSEHNSADSTSDAS